MKILRGCLTAACALLVFYALQILVAYFMLYGILYMQGSLNVLVLTDELFNVILARISMPATLLADLAFAVTVFFAAVLLDKERNPFSYLAINKLSLYTVPILLCFGIAASVLIGFVWPLLPFPQSMWDYYNSLVEPLGMNEPVTVVTAVLIVPIAEEFLCRSVMIREFRRFMHPVLAVFVSASLFGLIHGNLIQGTYAFACGVILGFVYLRYRSVAASILFHMGFNASNYILQLLPQENDILLGLITIALLGCALLFGFLAFFFNGKHAKDITL